MIPINNKNGKMRTLVPLLKCFFDQAGNLCAHAIPLELSRH